MEDIRKQGCNTLELRPKSKYPKGLWRRWITETNEEKFDPESNYGVIGGKISNHLVIIDIDGAPAGEEHKPVDEEFLDRVFKDVLRKTLVVRTGSGGYHIYIRNSMPRDKPMKSVKLENGTYHIDVQSEGKFVVGPGSTHANGKPYVVISSTTTILSMDIGDVFEQLEQLGFTSGKKKGGLQKIEFDNEDWNALEQGDMKRGTRNDKMHKLLIRRLCYDQMFETIEHAEEFARGVNDRMEAKGNGRLADGELEATVRSAFEYYETMKEQGKLFEKSKEGDSLKSKEMGDFLIANNDFITLRDNMKTYLYKDGIYESEGESVYAMVSEQCYNSNVNCKKAWVDEVANYIKSQTLHFRSEFDNNPDMIVVNNGILNIKTKKLTPHTPSYMAFVKVPIDFNPKAKPLKFIKFLKECFTIDGVFNQTEYYMCLEVMALTLLKHSRFEKAVMFIGSGANGKSTFLDVLQKILGSKNVSSRTMHDLSKEKFAKIDLYNKMANIFSDIQGSELYDTGMLKAMISGDVITAEEKFGKPFAFRPYSKLLFSANRFPAVSDQSDGFFRRFIIIEWLRVFKGKEKDIHLKKELTQDQNELSGILNIMVRTAVLLEERGQFLQEKDIQDVREMWNERSEPINTFLDQETEPDDSEQAFVGTGMLYSYYVRWCKDNKLVAEKQRRFNKVVGDTHQQNVKKVEGSAVRGWSGIRLKHPLGGKQTGLKTFD